MIDALNVKVDAPGLIRVNDCSHLMPNETDCSYSGTMYACHSVSLETFNLIGKTTSTTYFECELYLHTFLVFHATCILHVQERNIELVATA